MHPISCVPEPKREVRVVERAHRTLTKKLYRYYTYKNTYRFVNVLQQFVKAYNTINTAHGVAPAAVTDKPVLVIWTRMNASRSRVRVRKLNSMWDSVLESVRKK